MRIGEDRSGEGFHVNSSGVQDIAAGIVSLFFCVQAKSQGFLGLSFLLSVFFRPALCLFGVAFSPDGKVKNQE